MRAVSSLYVTAASLEYSCARDEHALRREAYVTLLLLSAIGDIGEVVLNTARKSITNCLSEL